MPSVYCPLLSLILLLLILSSGNPLYLLSCSSFYLYRFVSLPRASSSWSSFLFIVNPLILSSLTQLFCGILIFRVQREDFGKISALFPDVSPRHSGKSDDVRSVVCVRPFQSLPFLSLTFPNPAVIIFHDVVTAVLLRPRTREERQ